jgi:hypothetical protein
MLEMLKILFDPRLLLILIGIGASSFVGGYWRGEAIRARADHTRELQIQLDNARADLALASKRASDAEAVLAGANANIASLQQERDDANAKVEDYAQELAQRTSSACLLSPDDARRLRDIGSGAAPATGRRPGKPAGHAGAARAAGQSS